MYIVYVRHYLNKSGLVYFKEVWLPLVKSLIDQQIGFVSLVHDFAKDANDCINVIVTFDSQFNLEKWAEHKDHDSLINALDNYRSRDYWEFSCSEDQAVEYNNLEWQKVGS